MRAQKRTDPAIKSKYPYEIILHVEELVKLVDCDPEMIAKVQNFTRQFGLVWPTSAPVQQEPQGTKDDNDSVAGAKGKKGSRSTTAE